MENNRITSEQKGNRAIVPTAQKHAPRGKRERLLWVMTGILLAVSVLVIYVTHRAIPFMMDDLWYSTMLYDETPISSLSDIIKSQVWHFNNWGGRSMTHAILQLTLLAGEQAADILNVIFTLLLAGMVCLVSRNRRLPAFFAASAMLLGLNANWRMSMFWQAGAANYLYITVFVLAFLFCYLRELPEDGSCTLLGSGTANAEQLEAPGEPKPLTGITLWIIPLGVLAGWSNENMGPAVWILSVLVMVLIRKRKRKIKLWMISGSLACLFGTVMCIAAPGNFVRSAQIKEEQYGILWRLFLRCYGESKAALEYLFPTLLVLWVVIFVHKSVLKQALDIRTTLLLFCALLSWGAFILSPHYPDRSTFGTMVLCICVILLSGRKICAERRDLIWPLWGGTLLIWLRGMYFCGQYLASLWGWL